MSEIKPGAGLSFPTFHERSEQMSQLDLARVELTNKIRDLIRDAFITSAGLDAVQKATDFVSLALEQVRSNERHPREVESQMVFLDRSPLMGVMNALSVPLAMSIDGTGDDRSIVGRVTFTEPYEGPPGHVHGGYVAAGFDEVLGMAQSLSGRPGLTGNLSVTYRNPAPLFVELVYRGVCTEIIGRKIFTKGTLHHGDVLCAESTGLFLSMKPEVMARLFRDHEQGTLTDPQ
ncbi:MAG: PaaI family thioesterase [Ilumatobacteraceae bacterium]|nr:PaaI family thioesterase [Ilumatobacteraceae bacterium]